MGASDLEVTPWAGSGEAEGTCAPGTTPRHHGAFLCPGHHGFPLGETSRFLTRMI